MDSLSLLDRILRRKKTVLSLEPRLPEHEVAPSVALGVRPKAAPKKGRMETSHPRVPAEVGDILRDLALDIAQEMKRAYGDARVPPMGTTAELLLAYHGYLPTPTDELSHLRLRALHHILYLRGRAKKYGSSQPGGDPE